MFRFVAGIAITGSGHRIPTPKFPLRQAKSFHTTPAPQPRPRHHELGQNSAKSEAKVDTNSLCAMNIKQRWVWGALDGAMFVVGLFGGYHLTTFCLEKVIEKDQPRNNYSCMVEAVKEDKDSNRPHAGSCGQTTDSSGPCRSECQGECLGSAYPHGVNRWI
ncbi:hypothetical protein K456DRAFT_35235 [Colletotrichum gloeosporioides 23]|nr:hypothetical protein K456DRAFT_35235 [Colletotrichum gloeosporioides 23]